MTQDLKSAPQVIAIDGPSGSGKGTISYMLAKQLGYHLLDSGALYRLVALAGVNKAADLQNEAQMAEIAASLDVNFDLDGSRVAIVLENEDVTDAIRAESVGMNASIVAAHPAVRRALLERQRAFAQPPGLVADGRDMGTTVFPDASHKIFLTASAEARADRRCKQLQQKGVTADWDQVVADIRERDQRDSSRAASPLVPAADATIIDSTHLTIGQVMSELLAVVGR